MSPTPGPLSAWAEEELSKLSSAGLRRVLEPLSSPQGPVVGVGGETLLCFSSNDYLGFAAHPRIAAAARAALSRLGTGSGASRLVVGDTLAHRSLELRLAGLMGSEAAVLFNGGYSANVGTLAALLGEGDVVFSDALNHASLIDGCRLSKARRVVYPHLDVAALDRLLEQTPGRRRLVCTDALFSMDGEPAPLAALLDTCRRHGAAMLVDEAHAVGVFGERGAGLCEALGIASEIDARVGTLGKALGVFGAFVATSAPVAELLVNRARSLVFSTSLPAALCAAAEEALVLLGEDPHPRARLWAHIERLAAGLQKLGYPAVPRSPIFPVVLGTPGRALQAAAQLRSRGLLVKPIRPPTVPEGTSRLRIALSGAHQVEHLDRLLEALSELELADA